MTRDEYQRKDAWLRDVLADATRRGDYHLEMDVREQLEELREQYEEEEQP